VTEQELRLAAVAPLRDQTGQIIGALVVNRAIDGAFLDAINFSRTDVALSLIHNQQIPARTTTNGFSTVESKGRS
jgi:phage-related protein